MPTRELLARGTADRREQKPAGTVVETTRLRHRRRWLGLAGFSALLLVAVAASVTLGARELSLGTVLEALTAADPRNNDHTVVLDLRLPRTVIGLLGGLALGLVGALMQGLTRNPIADPGLLGINAGASLMVIVAITSFDVANASGYVWFAFTGAAIAGLVVYGAASLGWEGVTPVKLALVGAAFTAVATSLITLVLLVDHTTLQEYRFWVVGSLAGRSVDVVGVLAPFLVVGVVLALASGRVLNMLALGDDLARGLGQSVAVGRLVVVVAVVLLSGSATSLIGPVAFVGLVVPHVGRAVAGPDYRWILPYSAVLGALLLLAADIVGRMLVRPSEIEVGLVVAFLGAPVMMWLIWRSKAVSV
jgi:iron complex transport system permease protein